MSFDWTGRWDVEASVPGGGAYAGFIDFAPFGPGFRLTWTIDGGVGRYEGIGLSAGGRLFVSCGPALEGLGLVLVAGGEGRALVADAAGRPEAAAFRAESVASGRWRFG
ncbi:MAG: hypothetical protein K2Q06_02000, partial [Parvularculaceae bacterium]|nr:hypothetical protein [Parvularculaceae bacterium]